MDEFSRVSLGFAEFVSQLLHETFEAALSAQNYQLEKYLELEKALNLSTDQFKNLYIDEDQINEKEIEIFGTSIVHKMSVSEELLSVIKKFVENIEKEGIVYQNKLTKKGLEVLKRITLEKLVEEKKMNLNEFINKTEMVRLMVDTGEIRAKLELSFINQITNDEEKEKEKSTSEGTSGTAKKITSSDSKESQPENLTSRIIEKNGKKTREIYDPVSKQKILIIDKDSIEKKADVKASIPGVRLIATPAQVTSSSNLYSEVIIKFKTI